MRRRKVERNPGQVINNFFTLVTIVIMTAVITMYIKYVVEPQNEALGNPDLPCQKLTYTSQKIFNESLLQEAYALYNQGQFVLNGGVIPSEHAPSKIKELIDIPKSDKLFLDTINKNVPKDMQRYVTIKYEVIENDKEDPRKKSEECRLVDGSLMTSFRVNGKEAYRMYTDFEKATLQDISQRVQCTIKAFEHNAKL